MSLRRVRVSGLGRKLPPKFSGNIPRGNRHGSITASEKKKTKKYTKKFLLSRKELNIFLFPCL